MTTVKISIDTMGSETPLIEIIEALNESLQRNINIYFYIFGDEREINNIIKNYKNLYNNSEIIHCEEFVKMQDKPSEVIRKKKNSSMSLSIDYVKQGKSDAILSCGNTGALMALSILHLKTLPNIRRPSIASVWPNLHSESIVLDLGANLKNDSTSLIDNAILGHCLAKVLFKMERPSIGLLNVGIEDLKGNDIIKEASEELSSLDEKSLINYYGFIEGSDISIGKTNIVVTDGFTGNIALKTAEGTATMVQTFFKKAFSSTLLSRLGYFFSSLSLSYVRQRLDPRLHNCGIFSGLNAPVIKCHGHSDRLGVSYAVDIVFSLVKNNVNVQVGQLLKEMQTK